mgnify:CR=1 FL=1
MYLNVFNYVEYYMFSYIFIFYSIMLWFALIIVSTFYDIMSAKTCIWIWIQYLLQLIEKYILHTPPPHPTPFSKNGSKNTVKNGSRIIRAYLHGFVSCQWSMRSLKEKSDSNILNGLVYFWLAWKILPNEPAINQLLHRTRGQGKPVLNSGPLEQLLICYNRKLCSV